jgi:hypothetical protein
MRGYRNIVQSIRYASMTYFMQCCVTMLCSHVQWHSSSTVVTVNRQLSIHSALSTRFMCCADIAATT